MKPFKATCDACGDVQEVADPLDVVGYSGTVCEQFDGVGTGSVEFFACVAAHLQEAIGNAIERSHSKEFGWQRVLGGDR